MPPFDHNFEYQFSDKFIKNLDIYTKEFNKKKLSEKYTMKEEFT